MTPTTPATAPPVPVPDPNPLDCEGHGSHVAGTTAGLGVTKAGDTYTGGYSTDIDPATMSIGPGVAPGASLYALKVFGCEGDTSRRGRRPSTGPPTRTVTATCPTAST